MSSSGGSFAQAPPIVRGHEQVEARDGTSQRTRAYNGDGSRREHEGVASKGPILKG